MNAKEDTGLSKAEKAALRERTKELKAQQKGADALAAVMDKIAEMPADESPVATRLHEVIMAANPELAPRTWYGMPAYTWNGKTAVFFQNPTKFESRYWVLGFNDVATLDDGDMWPTSFAIDALTPEVEARVTALVKKATGA